MQKNFLRLRLANFPEKSRKLLHVGVDNNEIKKREKTDLKKMKGRKTKTRATRDTATPTNDMMLSAIMSTSDIFVLSISC